MTIIFYIILIFISFTTIISIYNYFTAPRLNENLLNESNNARISVLIPARNEEENITACLLSVLKQDYENLDVYVLDDQSTDKTAKKVKLLQMKYENLFLIHGRTLPSGWIGKNWACHQLLFQTTGRYLLFLDSDVLLAPQALTAVMHEMKKKEVNMFSVFPSQVMASTGEKLIVPLMNWLLLSFLPMKMIYESTNQSFSAANGQFMLWDKSSYFSTGGHKAVADSIVEDMELARLVKQNGMRTITYLGNNLIKCRMYKNMRSAFSGYSKNFFSAFKINYVLFFVILSFLLISFFCPFVLLFLSTKFLFIIVLILLNRILISIISRQNFLLNILLHPLQMIILFITGLNSIIITKNKRINWKGRRILQTNA